MKRKKSGKRETGDRMALRGADRVAFLVAVAKPRLPTKKLVAALKRRRIVAR